MKIISSAIIFLLILSGCAVNKSEKESVNKIEEDFKIEKIEEGDIIKVLITSKDKKECSIFLNKRLIELDKEVKGVFVKKVKLKEDEIKEDILVNCN